MEELEQVSKSKWAKMWCEFNSWKFPEELSSIKPEWWNGEGVRDKKYKFTKPFMHKIQSEIGHKACNREWNKDRMTDEEHEKFYKNRDV